MPTPTRPPSRPERHLAQYLSWQRRWALENDPTRRYGAATGRSRGRCFRCGTEQPLLDLIFDDDTQTERSELCCTQCRQRWKRQVIRAAHEFADFLAKTRRRHAPTTSIAGAAHQQVREAPFQEIPRVTERFIHEGGSYWLRHREVETLNGLRRWHSMLLQTGPALVWLINECSEPSQVEQMITRMMYAVDVAGRLGRCDLVLLGSGPAIGRRPVSRGSCGTF